MFKKKSIQPKPMLEKTRFDVPGIYVQELSMGKRAILSFYKNKNWYEYVTSPVENFAIDARGLISIVTENSVYTGPLANPTEFRMPAVEYQFETLI